MDTFVMRKTKPVAAVLSLCAILFFVLAAAAYTADVKDDSITMLKTPPLVTDSANFKFIVFGDTRTGGDSQKQTPENVAFARVRDMVIKDVVSQLADSEVSRHPQFALFTADAIWQGSNPVYWNEIKSLIPEDYRTVPGKIFSILGNHELWQAPDDKDNAEDLFFNTYPNLVQDGKRLHNYAFTIGSNLFVNLCSGGYDEGQNEDENDQAWNCHAINSYQGLMNSLQNLVKDQYNKNKIDKVFIQYHKPSFSNYKHKPLGSSNNPYLFLSNLLKNAMKGTGIRIFIFNGHNHTTEFYEPEQNIWALVAGGGGAPQAPISTIKSWHKGTDLFWKGVGINNPKKRQRRANYYIVDVTPGNIQIQEMVLGYINNRNNSSQSGFRFVEGVTINNSGEITPSPAFSFDSYMSNLGVPAAK